MKRTFFSKFKRVLVVAMCCVLSVGIVACNEPEETKAADIKVWGAYTTEKILRDKDYTNRYDSTTLKVSAFRNENEATQLIISPSKDVKYTFELSDLKSDNGTILSKDSFSAYIQKYMFVDDVRDKNSLTQVGWYPEALVPYDNAVAYGENVAVARPESDTEGTYYYNNGIYINLKPSKTQPAGLYKGEFTLKIEGESSPRKIKVEAQVFDYTLSDEVHSGTSFTVDWKGLNAQELDSSLELYESYSEFMLDHRISLSSYDGTGHKFWNMSGQLDQFLEDCVQYYSDPRVSLIEIPYTVTNIKYNPLTDDKKAVDTSKEISMEVFKEDDMKKLFRSVIEVSQENNINISSKLYSYYTYFDEAATKMDKITKGQYTLTVASGWYHDVAFQFAIEEAVEKLEAKNKVTPADATKFDDARLDILADVISADELVLVKDLYTRISTDPGLTDGTSNRWENYLFGEMMMHVNNNPASTSIADDPVRVERAEMYRRSYYSNGYKPDGVNYGLMSSEDADKYESAMTNLITAENLFSDFEKELIYDTANIYDLNVGGYHALLDLKCIQVPVTSNYNTEVFRQFTSDCAYVWYPDDVACLWSYGAVAPRTPYPAYHTDAEHLPARLYRWMMYQYDIVADLYWAVWSRSIRSAGYEAQDYYETIFCVDDSSGAVGEGILLFPGVNYDVTWDGNGKWEEERRSPVASIRLKAIQDGLEDYDLLWGLEDMYKVRGVELGGEFEHQNFLNLVSVLGSQMYSGVKATVPSTYQDTSYLETFDTTRKNLAGLLELANVKKVTIDKFELDLDGVEISLSAPSDVELKLNGKVLTASSKNGSINIYNQKIKFTEDSNYLSIEADGKQYFNQFLSGKVVAESITVKSKPADFKVSSEESDVYGKNTLKLVEDSAGNYYEVTVKAPSEISNPYVEINLSKYDVKKTSSKLIVEVFIESLEGVTCNFQDKTSGNVGNEVTVNLSVGSWTRIELDMTTKNIKKDISKIRLSMQTKNPVTLRIRNIAVAG